MLFKYGSFLSRHTAQKIRTRFARMGYKTQIEFSSPVFHILFNFESLREYNICLNEYNDLVLRRIKVKNEKRYREGFKNYINQVETYWESYKEWEKKNPMLAKQNKKSARSKYYQRNKEFENTANKQRFIQNKEKYTEKNKEWRKNNLDRHKKSTKEWQRKNDFIFDFTYPMTLNIYLREDWRYVEKTNLFRVISYFKFNHFKKDA